MTPPRRAPLVFSLVLAAATPVAAGCVDIVDKDGGVEGVTGGEPLDAGSAMADAGAPCEEAGACTTASACCGVNEGTAICSFGGMIQGTCKAEPAESTDHTWSSLYADYFGGTGRAACAGNGTCHGSTTQDGFQASSFECLPDDAASCYASMTSAVAGLITTGEPLEGDFLYQALRKQTASGLNNMPNQPIQVYTFTDADLARISAWVAAGAPND